MIDPLSLFGTILAVVQLIVTLAAKAFDNRSQSNHKCLELAGRVQDLAVVLHDLPHAAANDKATTGVQERLKGALDEAFRLIKYCQEGGILSGKYCCRKVTELDNVDKAITKCIVDFMFICQVRGHTTSSYNQAKGGASSVSVGYQPPCVGWPLPQQQHEGSTSQAPFYQYQPPCVRSTSPLPQHAGSTSQQAPYYQFQRPYVRWTSPQQQHAGSTSQQAPYYQYQPPCVRSFPEEEAIVNNVLQESLASARLEAALRAEEEATVNRVLEESLASGRLEAEDRLPADEDAVVYRVLEESLESTRAEEAVRLQANEAAAVNRALEESLALARTDEVAAVNRVEGSEDMVWALDNIFLREGFH